MISLESRHAPLLLAILLLVAGVVWRQQWLRPGVDDCVHPELLRLADRIDGSVSASPIPKLQTEGIFQWTEGEVRRAPHDVRPPRFRIVRSFGLDEFHFSPKKVFYANPFPNDATALHWGRANGREFPFYTRLDTSEGKSNLTSYLYLFNGEAVTQPLAASFGIGSAQLANGTRPVTVFLVDSSSEIEDQDALFHAAATWLASALSYYETSCSPDGAR